jgi:DNA-binding transcriptional MerR regulator
VSEPPRTELRIGDVAKLAGTTPRTIRYYEEIGLLKAASGREPGAHRTYAEADVERLTELLRLKALLGVSLDELKELVEAEGARATLRQEWQGGVEDPVRRRQILEQSLGHIASQLQLVRRRRDEIATLEAELVARRRRVRGLMREPDPSDGAAAEPVR